MFGRMKDLKGKAKIEYYIEYYGWRTLGAISVCAIIIFLIVHFATNKTIVSGVLAVNCDGENMQAVDNTYFDDYLEEMGYDTSRVTMTVNCGLYVKADYEDQVTRSTMQTIQTMFVTHAVDVFLADEEYFVAVAQSDYLANLEDVLTEDELEGHEDQLVYATDAVTGQEILAGIRLTNDSTWLAATGWYEDGAVIGLTEVRKSDDLAVEMLKRAIN